MELNRTEKPLSDALVFDIVQRRARHDGWTADRQLQFIDALAECACVEEAAKRVGMSASSAYALRKHAYAEPFRRAWDAALEVGIQRLSHAAISRAIYGTAQPIFYKGEQIGERRHYNDRLTMFLLRSRNPETYGKWKDALCFSPPEKPPAYTLNHLIDKFTDWLHGWDIFVDEKLKRKSKLVDPDPDVPGDSDADVV
jgi:hypothetical protein